MTRARAAGSFCAILLLVLLRPWPVPAQPAVDLALVLAIDASASVDRLEFDQQVQGLATAFAAPEVIAAIEALPIGRVAVTVTHWANERQQFVSVPWMLVDGAAAAHDLAQRLSGIGRRTSYGGTSISGALQHALGLLERCPCLAGRRVVDLSGDGRNNTGPKLAAVRHRATRHEVTVNALAILTEVATLHLYFEQRLITGPAAFVEVADGYEDYARAIRRKLLRELATGVASLDLGAKPG